MIFCKMIHGLPNIHALTMTINICNFDRSAASKQCRRPIECFSVYGDEMLVDDLQTMDRSELFLKTKRLEYNKACDSLN